MYTDPMFHRPFIRGINMESCNKCQCAEQHIDSFYNLLFNTAFMMAKEKETEKMGKITISDSACKKFEDFRVGECFAHMGTVYMKVKPAKVMENAINLETGEFKTFYKNGEYTPIHEFHWTDKK